MAKRSKQLKIGRFTFIFRKVVPEHEKERIETERPDGLSHFKFKQRPYGMYDLYIRSKASRRK